MATRALESRCDNQEQERADTSMIMDAPESKQTCDPLDDTASNNNNNTGSTASAALTELAKQVWAWTCWSGEKTWDGLDFAGEVVANFLGLTRSKYQWMLDIQAREEEERRQRKLEARQRRQLRLEQLLEQEKRKLAILEAGGDDNDNNNSMHV